MTDGSHLQKINLQLEMMIPIDEQKKILRLTVETTVPGVRMCLVYGRLTETYLVVHPT
jgi:hypothetical protein